MSKPIINFSYNWNNKLNCKAFTTWRIHNSNRYFKGCEYTVNAKDIEPFDVRCVDIKTMTLDSANEFIARIDTGYCLDDFVNIVTRMYKEKSTGFFDFILLVRI